MQTRTHISLLLSLMVNAVLFGTGTVIVLSIPALAAHAMVLMPVVVLASLLATPFISWQLAPRLRLRSYRRPQLMLVTPADGARFDKRGG